MHSAVETHSYFFSKRHRKFSHLKVDKMSQLSHTSLQAAGCSVLTCSRSLWRCCSGGRCCCSQPWSRSPSRRCCRCRARRRLTLISSAWKSSIRRFVITEKAPTRAFSWLKAATTAFTFKTLLRHYAKRFSLVSYSRPSLMIIASRTQFHVERPWGQRPFSIVS